MNGAARPRPVRRVPVGVPLGMVLALTLPLVVACGGGGEAPASDPLPAPGCLVFAADIPAPQPSSVAGQPETGGVCAMTAVEIVVTDVADLFGADFVVTYPAHIVALDDVSGDGSVLASGGTSIDVRHVVTGAGRAQVTITRLASTGVDVVGARHLVRLLFRRRANSGGGRFEFEGGTLYGSQTPPRPKAGIAWDGGRFSIL